MKALALTLSWGTLAMLAACSEASPACPAGELGCLCHPDDSCNPPGSGFRAVCEAGICSRYLCSPGLPDCPCDDGACRAPAVCVDDLCQPGDCASGDLDCYCLPEGLCNLGLTCRAGVCSPSDGFTGGACFADDTCRIGNACVDDVCVACEIGALDCGCYSNGACEDGLVCVDGLCLPEAGG